MRKLWILLLLIISLGLSSCNIFPGDYQFSQAENNIKTIYIIYMPAGINGATYGHYDMVEAPDKNEFIKELNDIRWYLAGINITIESLDLYDDPTMALLIEYKNGALELVTNSFQVYSTSSTIDELIKLLLEQGVINLTFQTCDNDEFYDLLIKYFPVEDEEFD